MHTYRVRATFPVEFERDVQVCSVHAGDFVRDAQAKGMLV